MGNAFTNKLADETSPYLLQHAHNPVQWYPWGEEALARAAREDKPILLSIGYSACHWCHVMEHESFEDEYTAKLMNENFVNIKVDREERPDLDAIYMAAVQMATGSGGWPMTVFLTPDQVPFFCGTYFPPEDRYGMPGFRRILVSVAHAYREKRDLLRNNAENMLAALRGSEFGVGKGAALETGLLDSASEELIRSYDSRNGGFGSAPKFPPSMALSYLMKSYVRTRKSQYLEVVSRTLEKMACGGIYDHLGGGFHRYSVDALWLVPHFEKMLYDNALLARSYLDAYLLTGNELFKRIAAETLDYMVREMTSPEGGFYSSQDADSEGSEGKFFLWTFDEVESILGAKDAEIFCRHYDVTRKGNFEGKNILHIPATGSPAEPAAPDAGESFRRVIRRGRLALFEARERRARPGRDEKILTGWNGLALRSFAEASSALDRDDYRDIAVRNAGFLLSKFDVDGRLLRSYKDGRARFNAYLEDYACLVDGLVSLYEATFDALWLKEAERLARQMMDKFWDRDAGGFFFTSSDHETLIHRPKEYFDNATPSGNSVAAGALLRLWKLTGIDEFSGCSVTILENMASQMAHHPAAFPNLLCVLDFYLSSPKEIAIIGNAGEPGARELLNEVFHIYLPNRVIACGTGDNPFLLKDKIEIGGLPTAYVCENFSCGLPITDAASLARKLKSANRPPI